MLYCPIMKGHLLLLQSNVENVEIDFDFALVVSNSATISDRCDYIGTQIYILIIFCFPCIIN